jgi:superfamily II DNA or RNA helicase
MNLYDWQTEHAQKILAALCRYRVALDASETGLGKTHIACWVAQRLKLPLVIICPKILKPTWAEVAAQWGLAPVLIENYEKLRRSPTTLLSMPADTLVVWDEAQKAKGQKSQIAKLVIASKKFVNLMLSATLAESPLDLKAAGYLLGLHYDRNFWKWAKENGCRENPWGGLEFRDSSRLPVLHRQIFSDRGSKLSLTQVAHLLPSNRVEARSIEVADRKKIQEIYAAIEQEINEKIEDAKEEDLEDRILALLMSKSVVIHGRLLHEVERLKVDAMAEMATQFMEDGALVVLFVNYVDSSTKLSGLLNCGVINGETRHNERQRLMQEVQENRANALVITASAGGHGISLHDTIGGKPRVVLISPNYSAQTMTQTFGRCFRTGTKSPVQQIVLFAANTPEEAVKNAYIRKLKNMKTINDGAVVEAKVEVVSTTVNSEVNHEERAHAEFSPSGLNALAECSHFRQDQSGPVHFVTERGTVMHGAYETENMAGLAPWEVELVEKALMATKKIEQDFFGGEPDKVIKEIKLHYLDQFGHLDRLSFKGTKAAICDAKFGYKAVKDAENNMQGWAYALSVFDAYPEIEEISVAFLMVRRDEVSVHVFKRAYDYATIKAGIAALIDNARNEEHPYTPNDHCQYCCKAAGCPALREKALAIAKAYEPALLLPEIPHGSEITDPSTMSKALALAPVLEKWASGVKKAGVEMAMAGVPVPGFELKERKGRREITDAAIAYSIVRPRVSAEEFASVCKVSVGDLEDLIGSKAPRGSKALVKQELTELLGGAGALKEGDPVRFLQKK